MFAACAENLLAPITPARAICPVRVVQSHIKIKDQAGHLNFLENQNPTHQVAAKVDAFVFVWSALTMRGCEWFTRRSNRALLIEQGKGSQKAPTRGWPLRFAPGASQARLAMQQGQRLR